MDQPKIKTVYEKIGNLSIENINFYVLPYNGAKIAEQCKHCTQLESIYDFYQTCL